MTTQKLTAIIVDDEVLNIETLDKMISDYCPEVTLVARCQYPEEAVNFVNELKPDIVFLDVAMPVLNGFDFLNKFETIFFKIIFTTAYSEYSLKAIKYGAFDFLLKPINIVELQETVNRALQSTQQTPTHVAQNNNPRTNLAITSLEGLSFINVFDIIYCKSDNSYSEFILEDGRKILACRNIKDTYDILEKHDFFRAHQSYLVNGKFIKKYSKFNNSITMSNGDVIPIAQRKKEEFLKFVAKQQPI